MKKLTTFLTVLAATAGFALAQDTTPAPSCPAHQGPGGHKQRDPEAFFKKLDTNNDGAVSMDEFKASRMGQKDPSKAEARFKQLDTNGDASLSLDELKAGHHKPEAKQ